MFSLPRNKDVLFDDTGYGSRFFSACYCQTIHLMKSNSLNSSRGLAALVLFKSISRFFSWSYLAAVLNRFLSTDGELMCKNASEAKIVVYMLFFVSFFIILASSIDL